MARLYGMKRGLMVGAAIVATSTLGCAAEAVEQEDVGGAGAAVKEDPRADNAIGEIKTALSRVRIIADDDLPFTQGALALGTTQRSVDSFHKFDLTPIRYRVGFNDGAVTYTVVTKCFTNLKTAKDALMEHGERHDLDGAKSQFNPETNTWRIAVAQPDGKAGLPFDIVCATEVRAFYKMGREDGVLWTLKANLNEEIVSRDVAKDPAFRAQLRASAADIVKALGRKGLTVKTNG